MNAVLLKLWELSVSAAVIALVVMVLRLILKSAPRWIICSLWALVAIRLLLPFSVESSLSLMPEPPLPETSRVLLAEENSPNPQTVPQSVSQEQMPEQLSPIPAPAKASKSTPSVSTEAVLLTIWCLGAVTMLVYEAVSYQKLRRKVSASMEVEPGIYICDYIASPFVLGTLHSKIYLPSHLNSEDRPYILAHEKAHIARLDPLWKTLGFLLLALHWFNPVLWIAFILFCRDIESACDERVIGDMGDCAKVPYSSALLNCNLPKTLAYPLAFGEVGVRQRIREVLNYKKPALWISLLAVLALLTTAVCFLTTKSGPSLADLSPFDPQESVRMLGKQCMYVMSSPKELDAVQAFLKSVRYDPEPMETPPSLEEFGNMYLSAGSLAQYHGLCFAPDGSAVGIVENTEINIGYRIKNPEAVLEFFDKWVAPLANHDVSGQPTWVEDKPWIWAQKLNSSMLERLSVQTMTQYSPKQNEAGEITSTGSSSSSGVYNTPYVQPLMDLIHQLKPKAFKDSGTVQKSYLRKLLTPRHTDSPCTLITFQDGVNKKILAIRQEQDTLDFFMSQDYERIVNDDMHFVSFRHWKLQDEALLDYMKSLEKNSPCLTTFVGWKHEWGTPIEMAHGDAKITLPIIASWDTELVPPSEEEAPWGVRIRPHGEEGWMFFSFWPQGFHKEEENRYYGESTSYEFDKVITSYPDSVVTENGCNITGAIWSWKLYSGAVGDYVILSEGADSWMNTHFDELDDIILLCRFQGNPPDAEEAAEAPDETAKAGKMS